MFNIAFPEFLVIAIVALFVIGPDKLPKVARGAGLLLGKAQRFANELKTELSEELQTDDLKKLHEELRQRELGLNAELREGMLPVASVLKQPVAANEDTNSEDVDQPEQKTSSPLTKIAETSDIHRSMSS